MRCTRTVLRTITNLGEVSTLLRPAVGSADGITTVFEGCVDGLDKSEALLFLPGLSSDGGESSRFGALMNRSLRLFSCCRGIIIIFTNTIDVIFASHKLLSVLKNVCSAIFLFQF